MNKNKLSSVVLVLFVLTLFGAGSLFAEYAEPSPLAYTVFVLPLVLGVFLVKLRLDVKKEQQAAATAAQAAEVKRRAEVDALIKEVHDRFVNVKFPVAGVTFQNPDKTDRQKILLEITFNKTAETDVWLEEEDASLGDESGVRVMTDYGCVGYIRRSDKPAARRFMGKPVLEHYLKVEKFVNDEKKAIYRADVVFVIDRKNPSQQWYFDDLPEQ